MQVTHKEIPALASWCFHVTAEVCSAGSGCLSANDRAEALKTHWNNNREDSKVTSVWGSFASSSSPLPLRVKNLSLKIHFWTFCFVYVSYRNNQISRKTITFEVWPKSFFICMLQQLIQTELPEEISSFVMWINPEEGWSRGTFLFKSKLMME